MKPIVPGRGGQPAPGEGPKEGPPTPDIALQSSIALPADQRNAFLSNLTDQLRRRFPNVKVFGAPDDRRFGIFVQDALKSSDAIMQQATNAIKLVVTGSGIQLTIKIDAGFLARTTERGFASIPQAYDTDGKPDENGSITLQGLSLEFNKPSSVTTVITGAAGVGPISVGWTGKATDTLETTAKGKLHVAQHNKLTSDQAVTGLLEFFGFLVKWFGGVFFLDTPGQPNANLLSPAHPTAQLIDMLPAQILLPGKKNDNKVVLSYASGHVDVSGVAIHGSVALAKRNQKITIDMAESTQASEPSWPVRLGLTTRDMRPPLKMQWTAQDGTVKAPHGDGESVTFDVTGAKPGTSLERFVTVHVTDADEWSLEHTKSITIDIVHAPTPTGHGPGSSPDPGTGTHLPRPSTNS